jgi:hypothetical protein
MTYFNTTDATGNTLIYYTGAAESQEQRILKLFEHYGNMSASQCWRKLYTKEPLTSILRGITTLMNDGKLRKTDVKVTGYYGKPEYVYELPSQQLKLFL